MKIWKIESKSMFYNSVLNINETELNNLLTQQKKDEFYDNPIKIPKKGGHRTIYAVDSRKELYQLQKNIYTNFLSNILLPDTIHGFIKETNYIDFLMPHTNFYSKNNYLRLDIKDFFGSISCEILRETLSYYFKENDNFTKEEIKIITDKTIDILTYNNKVVQGTPSSPVVSNIIFRSLDIRIQRYCKCFQSNYTRYADDMLFSAENTSIFKDSFISGIAKILSYKKFSINYSKVIRSKNQISLGGYVVSDTVRLSRNKLSNLNRVLFYIENHKDYKSDTYYDDLNIFIKGQTNSESLKFNGIYSLINYFAGNRAFIISVLKYSSDLNFCNKAEKLLNRLESIILKLYENVGNNK